MSKTINLGISFFAHPKVIRLMTLAGPGSETRLLQLWCYIAEYRPETGGFDDWTPEEVEAAADWSGEKGSFVESLLECGLLHQREIDGKKGYFVHDWKENQPHLVKYAKVKTERKRAAKERWDKEKNRGKYKNDKGKRSDAKSMQSKIFACANFAFCNANAVQCSAVQIETPLSPSQLSETADRIVAYYAATVKPKKMDNSGSKTKFAETAKSILQRGTLEECLTRAIDNYATSRAEAEESEDEVKFRFGFQTFFGPKEQHWKDFVKTDESETVTKSAEILNAEIEECERKVANIPDWRPSDVWERLTAGDSDDAG